MNSRLIFLFFFFNDTATTEIYTLSLHDALPILRSATTRRPGKSMAARSPSRGSSTTWSRSEEHTSELQSQSNLVCRLLLEKKKKPTRSTTSVNNVRQSPSHNNTILPCRTLTRRV